MRDRTFVDTNVLVYAIDSADPTKQQKARAILSAHTDLAISAQVLNEFYVVATRKLNKPASFDQAQAMVAKLGRLPCVAIDRELVQTAIATGRRWQLSHWDSLIVEAARQAGCGRVFTEDLADGAIYHGIRIENPFR